MKKIVLSAIILAVAMQGYGQSVVFGVVVPGYEQGFTVAQSKILQARMEALCTRNGVVVMNNPDGFFLYPTVATTLEDVAEGGMQNIHTIKAEVTLSVRMINGDVIASITKKYTGAGYSRDKAMTSLIQSVNTSDPLFSGFMSEAKTKAVAYYQSRCSQFMAQASTFAATGDYAAALATLFQVPTMTPCYTEVTSKIADFYRMYQTQLCGSIKMKVEAALSIHDYEQAAALLSEVDPSSECYGYAMEQFKRIEKEVAKVEKRDWNFMMKQYNDAVSLEKRAIDAAAEVAKAYYSSKPTVHYTQVIR